MYYRNEHEIGSVKAENNVHNPIMRFEDGVKLAWGVNPKLREK